MLKLDIKLNASRNLLHEVVYRYLTMVKYVFDIFELIIMTSTACQYFKRENMIQVFLFKISAGSAGHYY